MVISPLQRIGLIGAAGLTASASFLLAGFIAPYLLITACYLFLLTFVCNYYGYHYSTYYYPLLVVNLSGIIGSIFVFTWTQQIQVVGWVLTVLLVFSGLQLLWLPLFVKKTLAIQTRKNDGVLAKLSDEIFSCFLQAEYADNIYLFEKRLHEQKKVFFQKYIRLCATEKLLNKGKAASQAIEKLFDGLMDISQLRHRVSDYTVFSLCAQEMQGVAGAVRRTILNEAEPFELAERVQLLEDNYHHVLKVTAREPLAFLLFIASLKEFGRAGRLSD